MLYIIVLSFLTERFKNPARVRSSADRQEMKQMNKTINNNEKKVKYNGTKIGTMKPINCFSSKKDIILNDLKGTGRNLYAN
jgi:hypothetical protein